MSKAGAVASKQVRHLAEIVASISEKSLAEVAQEAWRQEEDARIEKASRSVSRLAAGMGLPYTEPFVLDDFATFAPEHQRVCVRVQDFTLNYCAANRDESEHLQLIAGACVGCKSVPVLINVRSIADLAKPTLPHLRDVVAEYRCSKCAAAA